MSTIFRNSITMAVLATLALSVVPLQCIEAGERLAPQTLKELAQVRRATAKYHDISNAIADGYIDVSFVAPSRNCWSIPIVPEPPWANQSYVQ